MKFALSDDIISVLAVGEKRRLLKERRGDCNQRQWWEPDILIMRDMKRILWVSYTNRYERLEEEEKCHHEKDFVHARYLITSSHFILPFLISTSPIFSRNLDELHSATPKPGQETRGSTKKAGHNPAAALHIPTSIWRDDNMPITSSVMFRPKEWNVGYRLLPEKFQPKTRVPSPG